jgi:hypothetical protein
MTEDSARITESDVSKPNARIITAFCKTCNKITQQNYLGLELSSRKIASRCLECKNTNFQEEDPERWRNRNKKEAKTPLKEIEEEKKKIFGSPAQSPAANDQEDVSEAEPGKETEY